MQIALHRLGAGDLNGALAAATQALEAAPGDMDALNLMAGLKRKSGDLEGALACLDAAVNAAPHSAPLNFNRANVLLELGRSEAALEGYDQALAARPGHFESLRNRGRALMALARFEEAAASFEAALSRDAGEAAIWCDFGAALQRADRHEEAQAAFAEGLARAPGTAHALDARGVCLHALDRLDEALASYDAALLIEPNQPRTHVNRGLTLFALRRADEAVAAFDKALALGVADANEEALVRYNRGMAFLARHRWREGWPGFLLRWRCGLVSTPRRDRGAPDWRGERVESLRLWSEQGVGDEILFLRFVAAARALTKTLLIDCDPRLAPLAARAFPDVMINAERAAEAQCALGDVGGVLGLERDDVKGGAFFRADAAQASRLRGRYEALSRGRPIVGIAWASHSPRRGAAKTASLDLWGALLGREALFVNLQYGESARDADAAGDAFGCEIVTDHEIDQMRDLDSFAAQVAACDQVVSVSNTTVHLAGALGKSCIVLVPAARGRLWYWGLEDERTPWYDSVQIVRRGLNEDWADAVERAAAALGI